ncbi:MAG: acyl-homoserine-lactone synthase [Sphingomonadales bacterium]
MFHSVSFAQPSEFSRQIDCMYRQRKAVFVDRLKWDLRVVNGREIDQFDNEHAVYLLASASPRDELNASARLLPTTVPHLNSELFSTHCADGPIRGSDAWEISRVCIANHVNDRAERIRLTAGIAAAAVEFGLARNLRYLTFVSTMVIVPHILSFGWDVMPLGMPFGRGVNKSVALRATVNLEGLVAIRENFALPSPTLKDHCFDTDIRGAA